MYRSVILATIIIFSTALVSYGQGVTQSIELSLIPTNPRPQETFTARIDSFTMNLAEASITWRYNNTIVASGIGTQTVSLVAPTAGTAATLSVSARGVEGTGSALFTVRPGGLDVIWESPNTYVPPFYKGKALPAAGATLRITAISSLPTQTLSYEWQYNNSVVQNQSGKGRQRLLITTDNLTTQNDITVRASGGAFSAEERISVPLRTPSIVAYKKNNGFIDFAKGATNSLSLSETGTTIRFEPFNFTINNTIGRDLLTALSLGGTTIGDLLVPNELPLSRPDESGSDTIKALFESGRYNTQQAEQSFRIDF